MKNGAAQKVHYRTCNLCEAMCGIEVTLADNQIVAIRGDKDDPLSKGHICPKAVALQDIYNDPNRLKKPQRRTDTGWEEISWEEAFDEVVEKFTGIQEEFGANALGVYLGNPNVHNTGSMLYVTQLNRALGSKNRFSATSVDQLPHHLASLFMFGHQLLFPVPDIDRTDFFLALGANPLASNGSMMTAPGMENRLKALRKRGGRFVLIDPRKTESAALADDHHFIRPGSDVLFLLAFINVLFAEGLVKPGRLEAFTDGMDALKAAVADYTPEAVENVTGISTKLIKQLATDFAMAESAVCYGRMGVSTQAFGALCQWLIYSINILTGNLDAPGGAMFANPAIDLVKLTAGRGQRGSFAKRHSRVRNLPSNGGEFPAATMAEEILTPGEGQIKAMLTIAGNPVLSTPNGGQLDKALKSLEYMVAIDIYINETTRHANIILPPASGLENDHYDLVFHLLAVRNTAKYSPALFEPEPGCKRDWEIFRELYQRLRSRRKRKSSLGARFQEWLNWLPPHRVLDIGLRSGAHGNWGGKKFSGLSLRKLKKHPHGVDLGPLTPCLPRRLFTRSKRIELAPEIYLSDLPRVKQFLTDKSAATEDRPLLLIGRRHVRSNNSWMHNSARLVKGKNRCTVMIHPDDAAKLKIEDQETVTVASAVGEVQLPAEVTDGIMPGVVSIPHGWGHGRKGVVQDVAVAHPGVSVNDLTDHRLIDELSGNAAVNGVPVSVSTVAAAQKKPANAASMDA